MMVAFAKTVNLWTRMYDATFSPAPCQSSTAKSYSERLARDVIGAATKSLSRVSSKTTAGRILELVP